MSDYDQIAQALYDGIEDYPLARVGSKDIAAALRAAHAAGVAAERERCAGVADAQQEEDARLRQTGQIPTQLAVMCELTASQIAVAIRKGE